MIHMLKLLERFPLGDPSQGFGFGSPRTLNVMLEAMRLAFADRAIWMGDADFVQVPSTGLLSDGYSALRSALIDPDSRQTQVSADDPRPFDKDLRNARPVKLKAPGLPDEEGTHTTHFSIVDQDGNIVAYTTTIESAWGTGLMVAGYGFLLNNELTDFNTVPTASPDPNNFNSGANDVAPGKRPRSSMAPTLIFNNQTPLAAYGSPGGSTIINSVLNITLDLIDHRLPVQEAIDAPRISQTSANGAASWELGFSEAVIDELKSLGHSLTAPTEIGSVQAVVIDQTGQRQFGGADKRRIGSVISVGLSPFPGANSWGKPRSWDSIRYFPSITSKARYSKSAVAPRSG